MSENGWAAFFWLPWGSSNFLKPVTVIDPIF